MRHTTFCGCSICSADVQPPALEAERFSVGTFEYVITSIGYSQGRWYVYYTKLNEGCILYSNDATPEEWNEWVKENKVER